MCAVLNEKKPAKKNSSSRGTSMALAWSPGKEERHWTSKDDEKIRSTCSKEGSPKGRKHKKPGLERVECSMGE